MSAKGVSAQGDVCLGVSPQGGICQGVFAQGVSAQGGYSAWWDTPLRQCMLGYTPLWTEFLTHACENITFAQLLLRTVMNWTKATVQVQIKTLCYSEGVFFNVM